MNDDQDHVSLLDQALDNYNAAERDDPDVATANLTWHPTGGPVYVAGDVRIKALATDQHGHHWGDSYLVAESLAIDLEGRLKAKSRAAAVLGEDGAVEVFQMTYQRGRLVALLAPIEAICRALDLPAPEAFPDGNWARTWSTPECVSDAQELVLAAQGLIR
jgi:hypothetical protein